MATAELLVGLDVGTTSSKAVVFGTDGAQLAVGRATTPWRTVEVGGGGSPSMSGTELHAAELLDAVLTALSRALAGVPGGPRRGSRRHEHGRVGGACSTHASVPVAPVIAWHDSRDVGDVAELETRCRRTRRSATPAGLPLRGSGR